MCQESGKVCLSSADEKNFCPNISCSIVAALQVSGKRDERLDVVIVGKEFVNVMSVLSNQYFNQYFFNEIELQSS